MPKNVVIIASGETERRALPILWRKLAGDRISVTVRIPPHGKLRAKVARQIIDGHRYSSAGDAPDKYVILVDADGAAPDEAIAAISTELLKVLPKALRPRVKFACAKWNLEAWYFTDAENLKRHLGNQSLGSVDTSRPDEIQRPKEHLKNLLRRGRAAYTARLSAEIAEQLDPKTIEGRSPSFRGFCCAVRNGALAPDAMGTDTGVG